MDSPRKRGYICEGLIFGLGVTSAVVVILIIALVVVVIKLHKSQKALKMNVDSLFSNDSEYDRRISDNFSQLQRGAIDKRY